jgi:type III pantothenate kinase
MVKIVIDKGNSSIKYGVFDKDTLLAVNYAPHDDQSSLYNTIRQYKPQAAIVSSVIADDDYSEIRNQVPGFLLLNKHTPLPFTSLYQTPETLGRDRLAAVAGAQALYPDSSILIIDAGTAITYEILLDGKSYIGGNIAPGMEMRFKALNTFTSKLPMVSKTEKHGFPGLSTNEAIASGVINGMVFEMEGYRSTCLEKWAINNTLITGGDSDFFVRKLKKPIFANQNLVLLGLNRILEYNA